MQWEEYYEKVGQWATSTAVNKISQLESYGAPSEIIDAINTIGFDDSNGATRLLKKAINAGVKFSGEQLADLFLICDEEVVNRAIHFSADMFTSDDFENLYCVCDDDALVRLADKYELSLPEGLFKNGKLHSASNIDDTRYKRRFCFNCGSRVAGNFCPYCGVDLRGVAICKPRNDTSTQTNGVSNKIARPVEYVEVDVNYYANKFYPDKDKAINAIVQNGVSKIDAKIAMDNAFEEIETKRKSIKLDRQERLQNAAASIGGGLAVASVGAGIAGLRLAANITKRYMKKKR